METLLADLVDIRDSKPLLDAIVQLASRFFGADAAAVFLFREGVLVPVSWVGLQPMALGESGFPSPGGSRDYMSRFTPPGRCHHYMNASLLSGDRTLGEMVICAADGSRPDYDALDRELLATLARRTVEMLERVSETERTGLQRGSISRIARTLVRETELAKVAARAVELAISELKADAAAVWLASPGERSLTLLAALGLPNEVEEAVRTLDFDSSSLASVAASTGQTQVIERSEESSGHELPPEIAESPDMHLLTDVPLMAQDRLVGVFGIARKAAERPEGDDVLLATMADLLASCMLNAQLYEESERQRLLSQSLTSTLADINKQLAEVNMRSGELAEEAQRRAAELEATIANLTDAIFVCDPEGKIVLINDAGLEMIGADREGEELRTLKDYLATARLRYPDGNPIPTEELAISRALRGEVVRGIHEVIHDSRSGRDRHIMASAAPIRDRKGNLVGAVEAQSDITRLKELDILKDQFITVAAHEIKTPVTAIKGFAQTLLRRKASMNPGQQTALETIVSQSDRIDALVKDFLELSRMRQGPPRLLPQRVELAGLVAHVVGHMALGTGKHNLHISSAEEAWVDVEAERIHEVMMNLLDNAMRYSPQGGEVEVRVYREGSNAVVSVRDEGMGIPKARQENLFERFYRAHIGTSLDYGGLGVGLYISREIVRQHGGDLWFESKEGEGSRFFFSLPLAG